MGKLSDIFGQDAAIKRLRGAWMAGRLPHALLFAGPTGVGKRTTAEALAALFLCEAPTSDAERCGRCESCRGMRVDAHPDYHLVERKLIALLKSDSKGRDLAIDVIRDFLIAPAGLKPALGRGKVFVVDEADLMSRGAQNALLKTLEEPPGRTLIILLTDQPWQLLPTTRSRTQLVQFSPLPDSRVIAELKKRGIGDADAANAARLAEGSLGLAIHWLGNGIVAGGLEMIARIDRLPDDAESLPHWFKTFGDGYVEQRQDADKSISADQARREGLGILLRLAANHFRRKLSGADPDSAERLCGMIEAVVDAEQFLDGNVNPTLVVEFLVASLAGEAVS